MRLYIINCLVHSRSLTLREIPISSGLPICKGHKIHLIQYCILANFLNNIKYYLISKQTFFPLQNLPKPFSNPHSSFLNPSKICSLADRNHLSFLSQIRSGWPSLRILPYLDFLPVFCPITLAFPFKHALGQS